MFQLCFREVFQLSFEEQKLDVTDSSVARYSVRRLFNQFMGCCTAHVTLLLAAASVTSVSAFASEIIVNAALGHSSCLLLEATRGLLEFRYTNPDIPPNARVTLHSGWEVFDRSVGSFVSDWQDISEVEMDSVANRTWSAGINKKLYTFGSDENPLSGVNFVFKITLPNGEYFFDKGNESRLGFYRTSWNFNDLKCFDGDFPEFKNLSVANVIR